MFYTQRSLAAFQIYWLSTLLGNECVKKKKKINMVGISAIEETPNHHMHKPALTCLCWGVAHGLEDDRTLESGMWPLAGSLLWAPLSPRDLGLMPYLRAIRTLPLGQCQLYPMTSPHRVVVCKWLLAPFFYPHLQSADAYGGVGFKVLSTCFTCGRSGVGPQHAIMVLCTQSSAMCGSKHQVIIDESHGLRMLFSSKISFSFISIFVLFWGQNM